MILRDMSEADLDAVLRIEREVHEHPWTLGNFSDALRSKYVCKVYESDAHEMLGYAVLMLAVDDAEVLDVAVAAQYQRKGFGRALLEEILGLTSRADMRRMVLEVRVSNAPAIALYRSAGFEQIGLRRDYYPAKNGREDALLMGKVL
jgi:ribosomal-protein-alanine N-acetyltransferase